MAAVDGEFGLISDMSRKASWTKNSEELNMNLYGVTENLAIWEPGVKLKWNKIRQFQSELICCGWVGLDYTPALDTLIGELYLQSYKIAR